MAFKIIKKTVIFCSIIATIYGLQRFCHKQTDGFAVCKIRTALDSEIINSKIDIDSLRSILEQPLSYIGRGGQCYAFATLDNKYVVKLLKYNNNYPRIWLKLFPFPLGLEEYRQKKLQIKQRKLEGEYRSYQIAFNELKDETGIIYFHLQKKTLPPIKLQIRDKLGIHHTLPADEYQFYVQKKGTPFYAGIEKVLSTNGIEGVKPLLDEVVQYLIKRCEKKITDKDDGMHRNFAFFEGTPFQIDIGQFSYSESLNSKEGYKEDLFFFTKDFQRWLEKTNSSLAKYFQDRLVHEISALDSE